MTTLPTSIGIIGAGQMGSGIAQVAAQAGLTVWLSDVKLALAEKGRAGIDKILSKQVEKGKIKEEDKHAVLERITAVEGVEPLGGAEIIVEAATEDQALKRQLFAKLDQVAKPGVILASNTSSISITLLGAQTKRADRVIGMHFMNPVPLMALVEIVRGLATSEETHKTTLELARKLGKTCVTSKDIPGFIVNRVLMPLINEAVYALNEGMASVEDIDTAVKLGLNHPMGPLTLADLIGLDTCLFIMEVLHRELGEDKYRPCPLLRNYVAAGWLGRKSGHGFYDYSKK
jgi:3-hydroxybutyryl-CoA dehydrogenase